MMDDRWLWCGGVLSCLLTHSYILTLTSVLRYAVHSHEEKKKRTFLVYKMFTWYYVKISVYFLVLVCGDLGRSFSDADLKLSLLVHSWFTPETCGEISYRQETKASDSPILPYSWLSRDQNMFFLLWFLHMMPWFPKLVWEFMASSTVDYQLYHCWVPFFYWCHNIQHD